MRTLHDAFRAITEIKRMLEVFQRQLRRIPKYGPGGGSVEPCKSNWLVYINTSSQPTSGAFDLTLTVREDASTYTDVTVSINWDDDRDDITDTLEAESDLLDSGNLICAVVGGPIFAQGVAIQNVNQNYPYLTDLAVSDNTLNAGSPYVLPMVIGVGPDA